MSEFDKIIGYEDVKKELKLICDTLKNPEKYKQPGKNRSGGLILSGRHGVGKTFMAECFIRESGLPVFECNIIKRGEDVVKKIKSIFNEAVYHAPSIVFFDDIADEWKGKLSADEFSSLRSYIAETIEKQNVFVVATVTHLSTVHMDIFNFATELSIKRPEKRESDETVEYFLRRQKYAPDVNIDDIKGLHYLNYFADIEKTMNLASRYAIYENRDYINTEDIIRAYKRDCYVPSAPGIRRRVAYYTAGQAVVAEALNPGCVNFVSVLKYGSEEHYSNVVKCLHDPEDYYYSKEAMEKKIIYLLGGRAATEVALGETDISGCHDILGIYKRVGKLMVEYYAYGFAYGAQDYNEKISDQMVAQREMRAAAEMEKYYAKAKSVIEENRSTLEALVRRLQEKDVILRSEFVEIINNNKGDIECEKKLLS